MRISISICVDDFLRNGESEKYVRVLFKNDLNYKYTRISSG